jgi:hypothetical protein
VPQLMSGARKALDLIADTIQEIAALREERQALAKRTTEEALDQKMVKILMAKMEAVEARQANSEARLLRHLADRVKPLLERQAPQYEARLAKVEEQVQRLMNELTIETTVKERQGA